MRPEAAAEVSGGFELVVRGKTSKGARLHGLIESRSDGFQSHRPHMVHHPTAFGEKAVKRR